MLLTLFPGERAVFSEAEPLGDGAVIKLSRGKTYATARTKLLLRGRLTTGISRVPLKELAGKLMTDSLLQKAVKLSFFKAAVASGVPLLPWGALTGIRPGKIVTKLLESGASVRSAERTLIREYFVSPERAALCSDTAKAGLRVKRSLEKGDICLYIGIPFCPTRCSYCSFVSHSVEKSMKLIPPYLEALCREIRAAGELVRQTKSRVIAVYIGGGTPTTLEADQLIKLMSCLESSFDLTSVREYTVEAGRPDTITSERLDALKSGGVTRISINPQTMEDTVLCAIGRRHTSQQAKDAFVLASSFDFDFINADLIAGLPSDTLEGFCSSLDGVIGFGPENITIHNLSLKRGARLGNEGVHNLPSGEEIGKMLDYAALRLRSLGYAPYYLYRQKFMAGGFENVGWSKKGFDGLYNICIMEELCTILSLGAGGVTKLVDAQSGRIERIFNMKYPYEYINGIDKIISDKNYFKTFNVTGGLL